MCIFCTKIFYFNAFVFVCIILVFNVQVTYAVYSSDSMFQHISETSNFTVIRPGRGPQSLQTLFFDFLFLRFLLLLSDFQNPNALSICNRSPLDFTQTFVTILSIDLASRILKLIPN